MTTQTLLFCIGATKAGTSWLWDYLYSHPETHFPAVKELHYFDALEHGSGKFFRKELTTRIDKLEEVRREKGPAPFRDAVINDGRRWLELFDGVHEDHDAYREMLGLGRVKAAVLGDFTPAYSLLKETTYKVMAGLSERVRFIFLMRDPVARMWSNIRMEAGRDASDAELAARTDKVLNGEARNIMLRSNYRRTLNRLLAVVPRAQVHLEFYERLFTPEATARLCDFLGIGPHKADFARVVHGGRPALLPAGREAQMFDLLRPQYNYVAQLMGELPAAWTDRNVTA